MTATATETTCQARFVKAADKKHCVKFDEVPEPGQPLMSGTLYVQNYVLQRFGSPDELIVTISRKEG